MFKQRAGVGARARTRGTIDATETRVAMRVIARAPTHRAFLGGRFLVSVNSGFNGYKRRPANAFGVRLRPRALRARAGRRRRELIDTIRGESDM
jgi:hypothetical protein